METLSLRGRRSPLTTWQPSVQGPVSDVHTSYQACGLRPLVVATTSSLTSTTTAQPITTPSLGFSLGSLESIQGEQSTVDGGTITNGALPFGFANDLSFPSEPSTGRGTPSFPTTGLPTQSMHASQISQSEGLHSTHISQGESRSRISESITGCLPTNAVPNPPPSRYGDQRKPQEASTIIRRCDKCSRCFEHRWQLKYVPFCKVQFRF